MLLFLETVYDLLSFCCWQLFSVTMHAKEISKLSGIILLLTFPLNLFGSLVFHHALFKILNFLLTFSPITMFSHTILEDANTKFKEFMVFSFLLLHQESTNGKQLETRMHSSRMRTFRSSSRLLVGSGGVCPGGCIPACTEADTPLDRILDTRL